MCKSARAGDANLDAMAVLQPPMARSRPPKHVIHRMCVCAQVKANVDAMAALQVLQLLMGQLASQKLAQQLEVQEAVLRMEKTYNLQEVVIGSLEARAACTVLFRWCLERPELPKAKRVQHVVLFWLQIWYVALVAECISSMCRARF